MEKIPYKPGNVLESEEFAEAVIIDLTQNGYIAFVSYLPFFHTIHPKTKKELDKKGYKLKKQKNNKIWKNGWHEGVV